MRFTLDEIVREFLIESFGEEELDKRYPMWLQMGISGLRDLNKKSKKRINWARLDVTDNDLAHLPDDYIKYTKIGVCDNGQLLALGVNKAMCPPDTHDCGDPFMQQINSGDDDGSDLIWGWTGYDNYSNEGNYLGKQYGGIGGSKDGYYKVFEEEGYIALQGVDADEIVLEYHADVNFTSGSHYVHYYDVEALKGWLWWKYIQRKRSYGRGDKLDAEREYKTLRKDARKMHKAMTVNEIVQATRRGYRPTPGI